MGLFFVFLIQSIFCSVVLVDYNFIELQSKKDNYCYLGFGQLSIFVYCLLQKLEPSSSLPAIETLEAFMLPSDTFFAPVNEEHFLEKTHLLVTREEVDSIFLKTEFRRDLCCFLNEFWAQPCVLSRHSLVGQGISCFCPEIVIGVDKYSALYLFGQLLDGLLEFSLVEDLEVEAARAQFLSFVREQRQVKKSSSMRVPTSDVLSFRCGQPGFRSCHNLYRVSICLGIMMFTQNLEFYMFVIPGLPANSACDQGSSGFACHKFSLPWSCTNQSSDCRGCNCLHAGLRARSSFYPAQLFLWDRDYHV